MIKGDQVLVRKCYQVVLALKENHMWMIKEKVETLETVELVEGEATKMIRRGTTLSPEMKKIGRAHV